MRHFFYSLSNFIVALFFIMLGVISVLMPWFPTMRVDFIKFLLENSMAITLFGLCFLIIGIYLVISIVLGTRRHYYEFKVGQHIVEVDEDLIHKYLQTYFAEVFPSQEIPCSLTIKQNLLHVNADLPHVPSDQRSVLLEKIKQDLKSIFSDNLGYDSDYYLSVSFQAESSR